MNPRPKTLGESIAEADIAAIAWTISVLKQKVIPFLELHIDCPLGVCPFAEPSHIITNVLTVDNLQTLVDSFNAQRISEGKAPLKTFVDSPLAEGDSLNA